MKKYWIALSVSALFIPGVLFATPAWVTDEVVITSTRYPVKASQTGDLVEVLTQQQIRQLGILSLREALNTFSDISALNAGGTQTIVMRGLASNQVKVMIDGIELKDPISPQGTPFLDAIPIESISRIEVIKGSKGSLQGASAMAGVVNIITHTSDDKNGGIVDIRHTTGATTYYANVRQTIGVSPVWVAYSRSYDAGKSWLTGSTEIDPVNRETVGIGGSHVFPFGKATVVFHKNTISQSLDEQFNGTDDPNHTSSANQDLIGLSLDTPLGPQWDSKLAYTHTFISRIDTNPTDNINTDYSDSTFRGRLEKVEWLLHFKPSPGLNAIVGLDTQTETGDSISTFISSPFPPSITVFNNISQSYSGIFTELSSINPILSMRLNLRQETHANQNILLHGISLFNTFPVIDVDYLISVKTGFREPTLYERYSSFGTPSLNPENSLSKELSVSKKWGILDTQITAFINDVENQITFDTNSFTYKNEAGLTHSKGIEYSITTHSIPWLDHLRAGFTTITANTNGAWSNRVPQQKFTLTAVKTIDRWTLGLVAINRGKMRDGTATMPAYTVINTQTRYKWSDHLAGYILIQNLTHNQIEDLTGYQPVGRQWVAGMEWKW